MLPDSQLPSHRFELWCKATTVQNQAIALTHARLSFPRAQARVRCCGLPRKKDGEGERSAPGPYLAAARAAIPPIPQGLHACPLLL